MADAPTLEFPIVTEEGRKVGVIAVPLSLDLGPAEHGTVKVNVTAGEPEPRISHEHDGCVEDREVTVYVDGPTGRIEVGTVDGCDECLPT